MIFSILAQATQPENAQDLTILLGSSAGVVIVTGIVLKAVKEWLPKNKLPLQVWSAIFAIILTLTGKFVLHTMDGDIAALVVGAILNSLTGMGTFALIDAPKDSAKTLNE